jgi:carboxylate-amine ligase
LPTHNEYTIGVEEEYQIIDPDTRDLSPSGEAVLKRTRHSLGEERVVPEMRASQIEALTPPCRTLSKVRSELVRLRRGVIEAAEAEGLLVAAASTHPFSHWRDQPITEEKRYQKIRSCAASAA